MRQRVMIAMALANDPRLLIADEPTTALDVTVQAQVLALLRDIRDRTGLAILLITHDLGVIAEVADRVLVMYAGRVVEEAPVHELFDHPGHPYSLALMQSRPARTTRGRLRAIPGQAPDIEQTIPGCAFHPRCPLSAGRAICREVVPELAPVAAGHLTACHFSDELLARPVDLAGLERV
jgi:oligopeptide/dipeptide ABC transporter ATP-binding protein